MNAIAGIPPLPASEIESIESHREPAPSSNAVKAVTSSRLRRCLVWMRRWTGNLFDYASLVGLLALCAAVPIVQLITLGYLLSVAGKIARGSTVAGALSGLRQAGKIGLAMLAILVASIPSQVLANWESAAAIVEPGATSVVMLRIGAFAAAGIAMVYLAWAWVRGGRCVNYLWPAPVRFLTSAWRPSTWSSAPDRLWSFTTSLELPRLFWLWLRGAAATLVWLLPAMVIIAANRNGETGLAGLVGGLAFIALGVVMLYLPMLQVNFAAENHVRGLFRVGLAREDFRCAPWAWLGAMVVGLVLAPLPLYLLKIEATPREVVWLPCLVFVLFMLPARICQGLAIRRARSKARSPTGFWATLTRWIVRVLMVAVVGIYMLFVYLSQYTSWVGLDTWIQQHAILVPYPFVGV